MTTPAAGTRDACLEPLRAMVEAYLADIDFRPGAGDQPEDPGPEGLVDAVRYSLLAGGKRLRPVLALATGQSLGVAPERLLPAAAAIELVHTYSLIHDDLPCMDDDDLRRGRPTCHLVYGEAVAILAGDALFAEAMRLVCERQPGSPETRLAILREIVRASGVSGLVGGQYLDLGEAGRESAEALGRVHALKTGRLMACAVHIALVVAPPEPHVELAYRAFARELGRLFQLVDDILDVDGSEDALGKPVGSDARHDRASAVTVLGLDRAREAARAGHARASAVLAELPGPVEGLLALTDLAYARRH